MAASTSKSSDVNDLINLRIRSHFFVGSYTLTVEPTCLVRDLKRAIISSYYTLDNTTNNSFIMNKLLISHRLIGPKLNTQQNRTLRDNMTVTETQLSDGDELYLLRSLPSINSKNKQGSPKQLEIDELQDQILMKEIKKEMKNVGIPTDEKTHFITALDIQELQAPEFFSDIRRILTMYLEVLFITLCSLCSVNNPPIEKILTDIKNHFLYTLYPTPLNPAYVIEYREMGYSPHRTKYAFFKTKNRCTEAAEWLKENKSLESLNIPESDTYQNEIENVRYRFSNVPINDIEIMLSLFEEYREYTFKPDMFANSKLQEFEYETQDIELALRKATNSYPAALRILAGDSSTSLNNMAAFSYPNRLYQAMNDRLFRYHLLDTKVIMALLAFFREPEKVIFGWCWNRDVAPIIFEMFETYNLEIQDLHHCESKYGSTVSHN